MEVNLTQDLASLDRQIDAIAEDVRVHHDELEDARQRLVEAQATRTREVRAVIDCLDKDRPALLTLVDGSQLQGIVSNGSIAGFVSNGPRHSRHHNRFSYSELAKVEQDDLPESPFQVVAEVTYANGDLVPTDSFKLTGRSQLQVAAVLEVAGEIVESSTVSTITFCTTPSYALRVLNEYVQRTPGRRHPKASLHGVVRALQRLIADSTPAGAGNSV